MLVIHACSTCSSQHVHTFTIAIISYQHTEFVDYTPLTFQRSFDIGGPSIQCVPITLFNDSLVEETEFFTVILSGSVDVTTDPVNASSIVYITDANGKLVVNNPLLKRFHPSN